MSTAPIAVSKTCPKCGRAQTRMRGNLSFKSLQNAFAVQYERHVARCAGPRKEEEHGEEEGRDPRPDVGR